MHGDDLIELIRLHHEHIRDELEPDKYNAFLAAVAALRQAGGDRKARRTALLRIQRALLSLPLDSPVRQAISEGVRLAPAVQDVDPARVAELLRLLEPDQPRDEDGLFLDGDAAESAATREILRAARRRLLAVPARPADQLVSGAAEGLIGLPDPERGARYPEFQFAPDGGPWAVVTRINALLLADQDPWGAADWWLGGNGWLAGVPAELIGEVPDTLLVEAARALVEGD
ncbi:hypothetical protein RM844_22205 [Streptomyces sp. DSM 44915]|uniref:Uncharacterized protein n=1 Tax=Streptomyces chisholmiae TaxID=3075540 RepID=A0ABU2JVW3_9ACTN|nr:hypothetical protein [Streptomyces sp. DSM 44915]MDT0269002.1 hypothetical protein [Streptomyces sp. DSM 44915]